MIVVDGLDETRAEPGDNPLPRFLPHVMPAGIRFLCATRPTYPHLNWLDARSPVRRIDLDDARWAASNDAVVRGFWEAVGPEYQPPLSGETIAAAITRAEGNVLHAVMLHGALRDLPAAEHRADRVPRGLKALIGEIWDQAASHAAVRVGLGLLCAAREALSIDVLAEIAGWSYDEKERFVSEARQLLERQDAEGVGRCRLHCGHRERDFDRRWRRRRQHLVSGLAAVDGGVGGQSTSFRAAWGAMPHVVFNCNVAHAIVAARRPVTKLSCTASGRRREDRLFSAPT